MRLRASLPALLAALLALLVPSRAAASLPRPGELPRALINEAESLPQLPDALEEIDRREERRARCGVFCGEPLELRLNPTIFQARKQVWGLFGAPPPTGPSNNANARFYDPTTARFTTQDSFLGSIDQPPSLHRYAYGWNRPTFWIDRTGHAPGDWWDVRSYDWRVAGRTAWQQTGRIGGAAYNTVVATARETPRVIADAGVLGFEAATGFDTGYGLRSQTARSAGQRMAAGEWVGDVTQDTALGIVKGVTNAQVVEDQLKAYADYRTGRATLDEFENRMSGAAGSGLANAALAKGAHAWYRAATAKVVVESATQAPHEPIANITPEAAALAELASGAPDGTFGIANAAPAAVPAAAIGRAPKSGVICGSGGPCKVYEIPAEQLAAGKPYIGKTRRAIPERMADADHRLKTATGKPPQAQPLAENLTPEEAAGLEALLAQERGLGNLSNKIPPLDPSLPKNAARLEAARKLLKARQQ